MRINLEGFTEREVLQFVLDGLYRAQATVEQSIADVRAQIGGATPAKTKGKPAAKTAAKTSGKRVLSAEARERIAAAQRKRWKAHHRAQKANGAPVVRRRSRTGAAPVAEPQAEAALTSAE